MLHKLRANLRTSQSLTSRTRNAEAAVTARDLSFYALFYYARLFWFPEQRASPFDVQARAVTAAKTPSRSVPDPAAASPEKCATTD